MKNLIRFLFLFGFFSFTFNYSQNISSEKINFYLLQPPKVNVDAAHRTFSVSVKSPYNLTAEQIIQQSKDDFKKEQDNYANVVAESKVKFQESLKNYDGDVKKAKEQFEYEIVEFKKLSLIERLALQDKGQDPKLKMPEKPVYYKPEPPRYSAPNLNSYFIVDDKILASQIKIDGFTRGNPYVDIIINMQSINFQDNAGQTYANQPTNLVIKVNGKEELNENLYNDFEFVSSSSTDNINKTEEERNFLQKTIRNLNKYINDYFGFQKISKDIIVESVKNKGQYNDLEKANIYVTTNLKKLQANPDSNSTEIALTNMKKGIDIWTDVLKKINYTDAKADYNNKIARFVYFNLIRLNLALGNKKEAENYLNQLQENLINMKLDYSDRQQLDSLEKEIYK